MVFVSLVVPRCHISVSPKADEASHTTRTQRWSASAKRVVLRRVTILNWLPRYSKMDAVSDVIAGLTVGLTMVPQSIAYAALAGLTAQYGLYSAFMGSFVYVVFGTIKEVSIGPTSLMALLAVEYTQDLPVEFMILLAFLAGCVEFIMGLLNLGKLDVLLQQVSTILYISTQ